MKSGQHYDGKSGYYFDIYNEKVGNIKATIKQTIDNAPNGLYELRAMTRVSATPGAEGYYLFATPNGEQEATVFAPVHMTMHNYTAYDSSVTRPDGSDSISYVSNTYGKLWEVAVERINYVTDQDSVNYYSSIYESNGGKGYGWQIVSLQVEVKNHQLTVGITSDYDFTKGFTDIEGKECVPFSGYWFSADNFSLTLLTKGENDGWNPASGVDTIPVDTERKTFDIYNMQGVKVNTLRRGVNIVRLSDGTTMKIIRK